MDFEKNCTVNFMLKPGLTQGLGDSKWTSFIKKLSH